MQGNVYLVGAGPGDLELMTRKAYGLIKEADCLIYDHLIDPKILQETRSDCEQIYVGKIMGNHAMSQEKINQLLVEKAQVYTCVVRLKGGDVYVFGRGGEEGKYLKEHGISMEVVPGVSSSIGGLAYAGIPITHRGVATGFHVVTAHNQQGKIADIDYQAMARGRDTCVFLMGLTKVREIAENLMKAGMEKERPIAVISKATLPDQEVLVSTLDQVGAAIKNHPLSSPGIIVVGEVVNLRQYLNFYEEKPLFGQKILIPRIGSECSVLSKGLMHRGANVTEVQVGELKENKNTLDQVDYSIYTHLVLSSGAGVKYWMNELRRNHIDLRTLSHIRLAVVGSATAKVLWQYGLKADIIPETYDSQSLRETLKKELQAQEAQEHSRILVLKAIGNDEEWKDMGNICPVDIIEIYENREVQIEEQKKVIEEEWDMAVFTSSSAVERLYQKGMVRAKRLLSIGNKTSETLSGYTQESIYQGKEATYEALIERIMELQEETTCIEEED